MRSRNVPDVAERRLSEAATIVENSSGAAAMRTESISDSAEKASNITFAARKVRMASEYYVEATVLGRAKYRIGSFKLRTRANEWIRVHSTQWLPETEGSR